LLQVIESYAEVLGDPVDAALARAWEGFDQDAYAARVVRRRPVFFRIETGSLDDDEIRILNLALELQIVSPPYKDVDAILEPFRRGNILTFRRHEMQRERDTLSLLIAQPRPPIALLLLSAGFCNCNFRWRRNASAEDSSGTDKQARITSGTAKRIAGLRGVKHLFLPELDAEAFRAIGSMGELESLSMTQQSNRSQRNRETIKTKKHSLTRRRY
jgi:hypothetical protein